MATYNGQSFIRAQLDSIVSQLHSNWELLVIDDASSDDTAKIVECYVRKFPGKIKLLLRHQENVGVIRTFGELLQTATAKYIALSDQDDVWFPEKLQKMMAVLRATEREHSGKAVLVHSDLVVVDQYLGLIHRSLFKLKAAQKIDENSSDCLYWNVVTGSATLFNDHALNLVRNIPSRVPMHDIWIACCVVHNRGLIIRLEEPLIQYRQHQLNLIGTKAHSWLFKIKSSPGLIRRLLNLHSFVKIFQPEIKLWQVVLQKIMITLRLTMRSKC